jgi:GntR family transcriptional repressor for pyruvate dehydrogenase complex
MHPANGSLVRLAERTSLETFGWVSGTEKNRMFQSARSSKASENIVEQIRKAIFEGKLRPGDRLPTEAQLMESFQVSKATLREAMRALEFLGFLEIKKGASGGAFVKKVDVNKARDLLLNFLHFQDLSLQDLSEVRLLLEPYAAEKCAVSINSEDLDRLKRLNEQCQLILDGRVCADLRQNEIEFHRVIGRATGNPILSFVLEFVENLLIDAKEVIRPDEAFSRRVLSAHRRIVQALEKGDPKLARVEMERHVTEVAEDLAELEKVRQIQGFHYNEARPVVVVREKKGGDYQEGSKPGMEGM